MHQKYFKYSFATLLAISLFSGCGSDSTGKTPDDTTPDFTTTPTSKSLVEGELAVMTVSATNATSYSISGGADSAKFNIDENSGAITFMTAPDFENPTDVDTDNTYEVIVTATSSGGESKTHTIIITITNDVSDDIDEINPVFTSSTSKNIQENGSLNFIVKATDDSTPITYALENSQDQNRFEINATSGVLVFAHFTPDFEDKSDVNGDNIYNITVSATDAQNNKETQNISITITDDNTDAGAATKRVLKTGSDDGVIAGLPFGDDRETTVANSEVTIDGLTWKDDEDVLVNRNFDNAESYCDGSGGGWRLPTRRELFKIVNYSKDGSGANPMIDNAFTQKNNGYFWTSQQLTLFGHLGNENNQSFAISFRNGVDFAILKTQEDGHHARCVKGDVIPDGDFSLSSDNSIISDSSTNLQWSNDTEGVNQVLSWFDAKLRCKNLVLGEKSDWRLPNINELHTIKPDHDNHFTFGGDNVEIHNVTGPYWSSTEDNNLSKAKYIENRSHFDYRDADPEIDARDTLKDVTISKENNESVRSRCVRGGHL